jgi:hypothetical protein
MITEREVFDESSTGISNAVLPKHSRLTAYGLGISLNDYIGWSK